MRKPITFFYPEKSAFTSTSRGTYTKGKVYLAIGQDELADTYRIEKDDLGASMWESRDCFIPIDIGSIRYELNKALSWQAEAYSFEDMVDDLDSLTRAEKVVAKDIFRIEAVLKEKA